MKLSLEQLLAPVAGDSPAGISLEETGALFELESLAKPAPPAQNYSSDPNAAPPPPDDPDWAEVQARAVGLLGQSKDLRVAQIVALVLTKTEGLPGLRDGLSLIAGLLENFWDGLYPRLDPEDNDDPTERINAVNNLAAPLGTFGDSLQFIAAIRRAPAVRSRHLGMLPVGSLLAAKGLAGALPGLPVLEASVADGALRDLPPEEIASIAVVVTEAAGKLRAIEAIFKQRAAGGQTPSLGALQRELVALGTLFATKSAGTPMAPAVTASAQNGVPDSPGGAPAGRGEIRSREDVVQALDRICQYYERYEPASPLPFLLRRARRLVGRNFIEVMSDLAPDALTQIRVVTGAEETEKTSSQTA